MEKEKEEKTEKAVEVKSADVRHVGFGRRLLAAIIDGIIVSVISQFITAPIGAVFGITTMTPFATGNQVPDETQAMAMIGAAFGVLGLVFIISIVLNTLYYAGMLVYKQGQTLGKMALGIRVVSVDGQPISWGKAILREIIGKFVSGLVIGLGYLWVFWDSKKQAWHDKIAGTYVIYAK